MKLKSQKITMTPRPIPIPYAYRLSYRITLSCIILYFSVGQKACSITKFQTINNALLIPDAKKQLVELLISKNDLIKELRFDPHIDTILNFLLAENLIHYQKSNDLIRLTDTGKKFIQIIIDEKSILTNEIAFLKEYSTLLKKELDLKIAFIEKQIMR